MKRVTIQGVAGCFHDAAAREYFKGEDIETVECDTFPLLFEALSCDASMIGIVAIENTIAGSLLQNHELLRLSNLQIVGEQNCAFHMYWRHYPTKPSTSSPKQTPTPLRSCSVSSSCAVTQISK